MPRTAAVMALVLWADVAAAQDLGQLSVNPYARNSTANPYSSAGSPYGSQSVKNPHSKYGSPYSNQSATNPYATQPPKLYDSQGRYRGKLSANPYDPESISNPYGRYGSKHSADSIRRDAAHSLLRCGPAGTSVCRRSRWPTDIESVGTGFIAHPYGAGNPCDTDSPRNPYGYGDVLHRAD